MSLAFDIFCFAVPLKKTSTAVLSIWILVGGCGCPILISQVCTGTESWALVYVKPILASASDPMTFPVILQMLWMDPLFGGSSKLFIK